MKAAVIETVGKISFKEVKKPEPKCDEVLVKVKAAGICGSDLPRTYQGTYHYPLIPGHEMTGVIDEVGENVDKNLIGRHVAVFPVIPCMHCAWCETGNYAQCTNYNYLGSRTDGGFAEYLVAPIWNMCFLDDKVPFEDAAFVEPASVAQHAINLAEVKTGDNVVIFGAGPIGILVAKWAKIRGAGKVMLVDIDNEKIDFAKKIGFDLIIDSKVTDAVEWVRSLTGNGADIAIEATGSYKALQSCIESIDNFGKIILLGNPSGDAVIPQKLYSKILRKEATLKGMWNSVFRGYGKNEWRTTLDFITTGELKVNDLITHRISIEDVPQMMEKMHNREIFYNKVLIVNN